MKDYRVDTFTDAILDICALHTTLERCHAAILNMAGVGKELGVAETTGREVLETLKCLEELECYASIGKAEVIEMQTTNQLMFQSINY